MPRKQSDKIITHRIEFSPKERELVDTIINTQKENQRLDAVTSTLNAVGVAIGGSGALIAGLGLAAWFGYSVKDQVEDIIKTSSDKFADFTAQVLTGKSVDEIVDIIIQDTGYDVQELNQMMKEALELKRRYCRPSSQYYDEAKCAAVDAQIETISQKQKEAKDAMFKRINDIKNTAESINPSTGIRDRGSLFWWAINNLI